MTIDAIDTTAPARPTEADTVATLRALIERKEPAAVRQLLRQARRHSLQSEKLAAKGTLNVVMIMRL